MDAATSAAESRLHHLARRSWPALLVIVVVASTYIVVTPPGLPYDEPSHWLNVLWWLEHWSMPVIGDPGTSYEAQMGPVAYALYAVVAWPFQALWGDEAAFYAARGLGVLLLASLAVTVAAIASRTLPAHRGVVPLVVLAVGLNPMLLAVSTSVQNDTLSLVLGAAAILVALERSSWRGETVAGVLLGLAILTKVTVWPVAIGIAIALVVGRRWRGLAIVAGTSFFVSGWWFARNMVLYGDLTGRAGVEAAGFDFPSLDASVPELARHAITYLWLPTEYVRNVITSPLVIDAVVLLVTAVAAVGVGVFVARRRRGSSLVIGVVVTAVVAVVAWVLLVELTQSIAFRTAYPALLLLYAGIGSLAIIGPRRALIAMLTPLAVIGAWYLVSLLSLGDLQPFIVF